MIFMLVPELSAVPVLYISLLFLCVLGWMVLFWILRYDHIGIVGTILNHGGKTPKFTGHFQRKKGCTWTEWKYNFENIATVNKWNDAQKLQWLQVRLAGHAQKVFQHLSEALAASLERTTKALGERL